MVPPPKPGTTRDDLSLDRLRAIDEACERFERAWQETAPGEPGPDLEAAIAGAADTWRDPLLRELVRIDLHYRGRDGSTASVASYLERFPALDPTWLQEAIVSSSGGASGPGRQAGPPAGEANPALASTATASGSEGRHDPGPTVTVDPSHETRPVASEPAAGRRPRESFPSLPRYEILGELGRGGMGVVYKARQVGLDRLVALKMILAGAHARPEELDRFRTEAQAVARIKHPNIVQIFDVGEHDGLPFFSLEFVEGENLARRHAGKPMPPREAAGLVATLARAVAVTHRSRILHRDLKPANILMTADGQPKITDFGLAKRLEDDSGQTRTGAVMGTPSYMAPEQAWGHSSEIGTPADVYALGAILYDLLTGRPPFQGVTTWETLDLVRHREPVPPTQLQPKLPRDLETIALKCLQKDWRHRYATADDLADDLQRYLDGRPILARPVSAPEKLWRWARRNPVVASLGSAVALLVVAVAVVSSVLSWRLAVKNAEVVDKAGKLQTALTNEREARGREAVARKKANASAELAVRQSAEALDVVRVIALGVQDAMKLQPGLVAVRDRMLWEAQVKLAELGELAEAGRTLNPDLFDRTRAAIHTRLGEVDLAGNRTREAAEEFERAFAILDAVAAAHPDDPVARRNLAAIDNQRADVALRLGEGPRARELYETALRIRQEWVKLVPPDALGGRAQAEARKAVAESHELLGGIDSMLGDPAGSRAHYEEASRGYAALPPEIGSKAETRRQRFQLENKLGNVRLRLGDKAGAEAAYLSALAQREALFDQDPNRRETIRDLALSHLNLGDFYLTALVDPARARASYEKVLSGFERLAKADPGGPGARRDLAMVLYRLGVTARMTGDPAADSYFARCLDLREGLARIDPSDTQPRIEYMLALARCGRPAEAVAIAEDLAGKAKGDRHLLFQAACGFALSAEGGDPKVAEPARDRAFETLGALVKGGWKDRVKLETDPDLAPIRDDDRFAAIVALVPTRPAGTAGAASDRGAGQR